MNELDPLGCALDRLVDGELAADEYQVLLATLDTEPNGWKRCALAFLEAQALRSEVAALRDECLSAAPAELSLSMPAPQSRSWRRAAMTAVAMAASFLLALPLGPLLISRDEPQPIVAKKQPIASPDHQPTSEPQQPDEQLAGTPVNYSSIMLVDENGEPIDVPLVHLDSDASALLNQHSTLPAEMRRTLEETGHRVVRDSSIVPVALKDGSQVLLPIDRYRVQPVAYGVQ